MSFKLVDKIKKSNLPGSMKRVLEAYVSFGNSDGTSIRPTAAAVAKRAACSSRTVERQTPTLVRLGFLVHDQNEDGTYKTYNYPKNGVWAYVYRADISPLNNPALVEGFEMKRQAVRAARRKARGIGNRSRQLALFEENKMAEPPTDKLSETLYVILSETPTDKLSDRPDPITNQTQTYPSAVSTAVSEKGSEEESSSPSAPPTCTSNSRNPETSDALVSGDLASQPQEQPLHQMLPEVEKVWFKRTRKPFTPLERIEADVLCREFGYKLVVAVLNSALNERPKSAKMRWTRFSVFYENWVVNHDLYLAHVAAHNADSKKNGYVRTVVTKFVPLDDLTTAEQTNIEKQFKDHNKLGDWFFPREEREVMGFTKADQMLVVRFCVDNCIAVTKEKFIELLREAAPAGKAQAVEV